MSFTAVKSISETTVMLGVLLTWEHFSRAQASHIPILPRLVGSPEWAVETESGGDYEYLTELDTLPAAGDRQQADNAAWTEVTAVSTHFDACLRDAMAYMLRCSDVCSAPLLELLLAL